jgi:hypothetical protein
MPGPNYPMRADSGGGKKKPSKKTAKKALAHKIQRVRPGDINAMIRNALSEMYARSGQSPDDAWTSAVKATSPKKKPTNKGKK